MTPNRTFMRTQRAFAVVLGLMLVLIGGCAAEPAATDSGVATSVPTTTDGRTDSASPDATAQESAEASIAADADLAELLPATLGGEAVTAQSFSGEGVLDLGLGGFVSPDGGGGVEAMAESLDVALADIDGAVVFAADHEPFSPHAVAAMRFPGADSDAIVEALGEALGGLAFLAGQVAVTEQTIGDNDVSVLESVSPEIVRSPVYFYAVGDVAFIIWTDDADEAEQVLEDLP